MADYSKVNLAEQEDAAPGSGMEGMSFRGARDALGDERTATSLQSLDAGVRQPFGHRHGEEEEVYVVLSGSGRIQVEGDAVDLQPLDAIRVAPGSMRALEAGPEGLRFLAFGSPGGGATDVDMQLGWWGD